MNKFLLIVASSLLLGGCTLIANNQAAKDEMEPTTNPNDQTMMFSPSPDPELDQMATPSDKTDKASIDTDLSNTTILDEDFSDLSN